MSLFRNPILRELVALFGVMILCQFVVGTDLTRNVAAGAAIFWAMVNAGRYLPYGLRAFAQGGQQDNWRLLIGNVMFSLGFGGGEIWRWFVRGEGRPDWMIYSPMNWVFAVVAAYGLYMCFTASTKAPGPLPTGKLYYVALGVSGGILIGILVARFVPGFASA